MIEIFWSFYNDKCWIPMGGGGNVLRVKFLPRNAIFPGMSLQTSYQTWECYNILGKIKRFQHTKRPLGVYYLSFIQHHLRVSGTAPESQFLFLSSTVVIICNCWGTTTHQQNHHHLPLFCFLAISHLRPLPARNATTSDHHAVPPTMLSTTPVMHLSRRSSIAQVVASPPS